MLLGLAVERKYPEIAAQQARLDTGFVEYTAGGIPAAKKLNFLNKLQLDTPLLVINSL